jgi:hypothetical protein
VSDQTFFWSRLRWRLRGAWMWPTFVLTTILDGILLWQLPPIRTGVDLIPGILLATFGNLFLAGALAPWFARRLAANRRPPATSGEREVIKDRFGTALLVAGVFAVLVSGLAARPTVVSETEDTEANARAVRDHVLRSGDDELVRNLETANTIRLEEDYFRTCIARDDRDRYACFFVHTDESPPRVARDPSQEPNSVYRVP